MNVFNPIFLFWNILKRFSFGIKTNLFNLCVCIVLIWGCWWLYERFNTIPVFKNEVELYEYKSTDINPKIWINSNINYGIYKHTTVPKVNGLMYQQTVQNGKYIRPVFSDSLIQEAKEGAALRDINRIGEGAMSEKYLSMYDTLTKYADTFNINKAIYVVDLKYKQTYPEGLAVKWASPVCQTIDNPSQYTKLFETSFGEDSETGQKTIEGRIIKVESDQTVRFSNQWMFWNGLSYGNTLSNSFLSIFNLYDISQAYVLFKYTGNTNLDHLRFNFGSATMCTGVNPKQAEVGMDYVIYNDSVFLNSSKMELYNNKPINDFLIKYHIAPKDTQNLQTMRLFVLTTLFSLIFTFLLSCVVKIIKTKIRRFVPMMRNNADGRIWSVFDTWLGGFSQFMCHKNYDTKETCEFYINECNKYYKKHFKASLCHKGRKKK